MILGVDHIGIAVASIGEARKVYEALGLSVARTEEVATQKVRTAFLPAGGSRVELLEATSPDSPVAKFIEKRGPGIHHVCFEVDDLRAALAELSRRGYRLIDPAPVPGAGGRLVAFLHPAAGHGVLIELSQRGDR